MNRVVPNGREITFGEDETIVSKTDLKGIITYANDVFQRVSGYEERELLGQPHNCIRHPEMPACVFQLLWETLKKRQEIFAYVLNLAKDGSGYWVLAHVTPSYDLRGNHTGYHSSRRLPYADALPAVKQLYAELLAVERRQGNKRDGMAASAEVLSGKLQAAGLTYGQFVFSLSKQTRLAEAAA